MASQSNYEVRPSDLDQAFVRVIFVSAVVVWSYINAPASTPSEALNYKYFNLAFAYWTFSLLAYAWTYFFLRRVSPDSKTLLLTRGRQHIRRYRRNFCLYSYFGQFRRHTFSDLFELNHRLWLPVRRKVSIFYARSRGFFFFNSTASQRISAGQP